MWCDAEWNAMPLDSSHLFGIVLKFSYAEVITLLGQIWNLSLVDVDIPLYSLHRHGCPEFYR